MKSLKYLIVIVLCSFLLVFPSCKTSLESTAVEQEEEVVSVTLRDELVGEWRLVGLDEEIGDITHEEKEAYSEYMDLLSDVFLLTLFSDGTYQKNLPSGNENGRWRLIDGDSGLSLITADGVDQQYHIREYSNPLLRLVETKDGDKRVFHLRRVEY